MRCVFALLHTILPFIPVFVCAGSGWTSAGVLVGLPNGLTCWSKHGEETAGRCSSHSALGCSFREFVLPCLDKHLLNPSMNCVLFMHNMFLLRAPCQLVQTQVRVEITTIAETCQLLAELFCCFQLCNWELFGYFDNFLAICWLTQSRLSLGVLSTPQLFG